MEGKVWKVGETYSTHNHPTRYWETGIVDETGMSVARVSAETKKMSRQLAKLVAAAPDFKLACEGLAPLLDSVWPLAWAETLVKEYRHLIECGAESAAHPEMVAIVEKFHADLRAALMRIDHKEAV